MEQGDPGSQYQGGVNARVRRRSIAFLCISGPGTTGLILEALKPGTKTTPAAMGGAETAGVSPEADGAVRRGGLY